MENGFHNKIVSFIWSIADDELRDVFVRGKYRDVILPMTVIRRLDAVLEDTKEDVLAMKEELDDIGIHNQVNALCDVSGHAFYNDSPFTLKDLTSRTKKQQLEADFIAYLDGFSPNVQEILEKFHFRNQIRVMTDADVLGGVVEKFVNPRINLSPNPVLDDNGEVLLPGLDNHTMGTVFEELIRKFNEENNEEAGEHFTPRDAVKLMTDIMFKPVAERIKDGTYLCYDGACGSGGMLTIADERLKQLGKKHDRNFSIHLYGQESQAETYAIAKADMMLKGDGSQADNISFGSTLSADANAAMEFDFMLSNPPYGKSWASDSRRMGGRTQLTDPRFVTNFAEDEFRMVPSQSDGQLLFLANNIAKMKHNTELGSRIVQVHNGSSLFTGNAGQGESNLRRYIIEKDYLEAIIALPENMFYNTGIATYIWVVTNRKEKRRKGKVQLINATELKSPLRINLGNKNCELTDGIREQISNIYMNFEENKYSQILDNEQFGYYEVTVERPLRLRVEINEERLNQLRQKVDEKDQFIYELVVKLKDQDKKECYMNYNEYMNNLEQIAKESDERLLVRHKRLVEDYFTEIDEKAEKVVIKSSKKKEEENPLYGSFKVEDKYIEYEQNTDLRDTEVIPLNYDGGIEGYFKEEVRPFAEDAWINDTRTRIGYEISFTKYFYEPEQFRDLEDIVSDIKALEEKTDRLLDEIVGG